MKLRRLRKFQMRKIPFNWTLAQHIRQTLRKRQAQLAANVTRNNVWFDRSTLLQVFK